MIGALIRNRLARTPVGARNHGVGMPQRLGTEDPLAIVRSVRKLCELQVASNATCLMICDS